MQVIVDRKEEDYLVLELEDGDIVEVPKELIKDAKEGDVINITIDEEARKEREAEVEKLMNDLFVD